MSRAVVFTILSATLVLTPGKGQAGLPPLIPRKVLFGNPVRASPEISPDGTQLAYIAPDSKDVLQVWVQTVGKEDARQVTEDKKRGIRIFRWTYAAHTLLYLQDNDGDENWRLYAVDLETRKVRDLTPFPGVRAELVGVDRHHPDQVLVGLNRENRRAHDVYRLNLAKGTMELDTKNPGDVVGWTTDAEFQVRACEASLPDGGTEVRFRSDVKAPWQQVVKWGPEDADGRVVGFTADGKSLWMTTSAGRDTASLVKRSLANGTEEVVASDPGADAGQVLFNPNTYEVEAVSFDRLRVHWAAIDAKIGEDLKFLEQAGHGEAGLVSRDKTLQTWVVSFSSDVHPADYYLYHRESKKLEHLFAARPELKRYELASMKPVVIKSRDNLELVSYLTTPPGIKAEKLPMVLLVHGGPWGRDHWGFDPQAQWLANRGYAVLAVNFRGSAGFGKKFLHAGDREWAGKMHDDLIDAVNWAVEKGNGDPKRIAIFGGSYGGYAALVGAAFTPDVFACAVDIVGPSNLVTLLHSIPPYWEPIKKMFAVRVGDPEKEQEFLKSRSPLFKADHIKIPLLIAQGANDPRVKQAESEQMVQAIRKGGTPVEYMLFADEGHGFARPQNRLKFYAAAEAFLAKYLGGERAEPAEEKR